MNRRPTIPFFTWRLAVNLQLTKDIQNLVGMPAHQCNCELCVRWKNSYQNIIPKKTLDEMYRLGIQLDAPNELYQFSPRNSEKDVRIIYHIVGNILSGPQNEVFHTSLDGNVQNYVVIRKQPWFSVRVLNANESFEPSPIISTSNHNNVIALDFRLEL